MPAYDTPLMKQYYQLKQQYPGAVLLFRVGDFYETFGEDAVTAARILDITLTKRGAGSISEVALAGFPHHSLDTYLPKLVRAGQRVAICDQLEDPKQAKGLVKKGRNRAGDARREPARQHPGAPPEQLPGRRALRQNGGRHLVSGHQHRRVSGRPGHD
ncbi:MAG: hypothetical protein WKG07_25530 [Hymenobacter sp.]